MATLSFEQARETFGLETGDPWSLPALRLLFCAPRVFEPLEDAWCRINPGCRQALDRLEAQGFAVSQPGLVVDTLTGLRADRAGRPAERFVATAAGRRLRGSGEEDLRVVSDRFPRASASTCAGVLRMLATADLEPPYSRVGVSVASLSASSALPMRTARHWVSALVEEGLLRRLDLELADTREVVPAHRRPTVELVRQLRTVLSSRTAFGYEHLVREFNLPRRRPLGDIVVSRLGVAGATDYDHDVTTQRLVAALLRSRRFSPHGILRIEPKFSIPASRRRDLTLMGPSNADGTVYYQPDAELRETDRTGSPVRSVLEFERFQTRRDAWAHVERFLGWMAVSALPFESGVLRFVVESERRARTYRELVAAFRAHVESDPSAAPVNRVTLAVAVASDVMNAPDPLAGRWAQVTFSGAASGDLPLHDERRGPYEEFFGAGEP